MFQKLFELLSHFDYISCMQILLWVCSWDKLKCMRFNFQRNLFICVPPTIDILLSDCKA